MTTLPLNGLQHPLHAIHFIRQAIPPQHIIEQELGKMNIILQHILCEAFQPVIGAVFMSGCANKMELRAACVRQLPRNFRILVC